MHLYLFFNFLFFLKFRGTSVSFSDNILNKLWLRIDLSPIFTTKVKLNMNINRYLLEAFPVNNNKNKL